ncbi:hypothetical protein ACHAXR_008679 [Thalassiosira sp. AJA248-18]
MDANGDPWNQRNPDIAMRRFLSDANLIDVYHERHGNSNRTYMYGSKRIDSFYFDPGLVDAVKSIGYLGTHEGADSDHVLAFVDFDEKRLFRGKINRPVEAHSREFLLAQSDKVKAFLDELIPVA